MVRVLLLLAALLGASCGARSPASPPSPAAAPSGAEVAAAPGPPYQVLRQVELWRFVPDGVDYTWQGCLEARRAGRPAVAPVNNPSWKGEEPRSLEVAPPWELALVDRQPYGGDDRYDHMIVVVRPQRDLEVGERLPLRVRMRLRDVPYLHHQQSRHRLLSLTLDPTPGVDRQTLLFALPETTTPVVPTDLQPTEVLRPEGWRVYRYETAGVPRAVIHLAFDLVAPTRPLPDLEDLLPDWPGCGG